MFPINRIENMKKRNHIHITHTSATNASRILKETESIINADMADGIVVYAMAQQGLPEAEIIGEKREIRRVPLFFNRFRKNPIVTGFKLFEFIMKLIFICRKSKIQIMQCHSIEILPVGLVHRIVNDRSTKIVLDAHELESAKHSRGEKLLLLYRFFEKQWYPKVDAFMVVSDSIQKWYTDNLMITPVVIKNIPKKRQQKKAASNVLRDYCGLDDNDILFIYQGALKQGRNIDALLYVFSRTCIKKHIVFMGKGEMEDEIRQYANRCPNIHLHPIVPPDEVLSYTQSADIGLSLIEDVCLSYRYCLPNKLFEYLLSGVPVVVSDFPDMVAVVDFYECGWKVETTSDNILALVENITPHDIAAKKEGVCRAQEELGWDKEEEKLIALYKELL